MDSVNRLVGDVGLELVRRIRTRSDMTGVRVGMNVLGSGVRMSLALTFREDAEEAEFVLKFGEGDLLGMKNDTILSSNALQSKVENVLTKDVIVDAVRQVVSKHARKMISIE